MQKNKEPIEEQIIEIPYKPNKVQAFIHKNLARFSICVLHRGCGKTILAVQELIKRAFTCEDVTGASFLYVAPEKAQAKKVAWAKLKYYTKTIPNIKINESELTITFPDNGAIVYLEGASEPDRIRGLHPHFIVLDEVGDMPRDIWDKVLLPASIRNAAPILLIGTPKGNNLFKEKYFEALESIKAGDDLWFATYQDVYKAGLYTEQDIKILKSAMSKEGFEQEYMLGWDAVANGSYFADILLDGELGIMTDVPYSPTLPVITGWDLGTVDDTVIWFAQLVEGKIHIIDYYENREKAFPHYVSILKSKPYLYGYHCFPHDGPKRDSITLESRQDVMRQHGHRVELVKKAADGATVQGLISAMQMSLYTCRFDRFRCGEGLKRLQEYQAKRDKHTGMLTSQVKGNGADHAADAFRTLLEGIKKAGTKYSWNAFERNQRNTRETVAETSYDYYS